MIVVGGEALMDLVPDPAGQSVTFRALPGGSPANTAIGLARLGTRARFLGRLGSDGFGRALRNHFDANEVGTGLVTETDAASVLAVVTVGSGGVADYSFYLDGTAGWDWPSALATALPADAVAVHLVGQALAAPPPADLHQLLDGGRLLSIDPNVRPAMLPERDAYRAGLEAWVDRADLVKVSDADLDWVYPGEPVDQVARRWLDRHPALVVVTRGAAGSLAAGREASVTQPVVPVEIVDTVGAGDSFGSGLLDWLARHERLSPATLAVLAEDELRQALGFAAEVSAITCTRPGADPPRRYELPSMQQP